MSNISFLINSTYSGKKDDVSNVIFNFKNSSYLLGNEETSYQSFKTSSIEDLDQIVSSLFSSDTTTTGILPPGYLYHNSHIVIFEQPPTYKNISYRPYMLGEIPLDSTAELITLPIPWQIYIVLYHMDKETSKIYPVDVYMFFRDSQLMSQDDTIYLAPLSNFYANGKLCRPFFDSFDDIDRYENSIAGIIQAAYDWVWNSNTNVDLTASIAEYFISFQNSTNQEDTLIFDYYPDQRSSVRDFVSSYSYYVNPQIVNYFYKAWSKIDINDILKIKWSNPGYQQKYHDHELNYVENFISNISRSDFIDFLINNDVDIEDYSEEELENLSFSDFDFSNQTVLEYFSNSLIPCREIQISLRDFVNNMERDPHLYTSRSFRKDISKVYNFFIN